MRRSFLARASVLLAFALGTGIWAAGSLAAGRAASQFPTGKITITMFGSDELPQFQVEEGLVKQFEKLHPNVTVKAQQAPLGPAFAKLSTELPSGGGPTIFSVFEPWFEGFYEGGFLAPAIPEAFGLKTQQDIINLYIPNGLEAQTRKGIVYALPSAAPAWDLLVNKKEFTKAGLSLSKDVPRSWAQVAKLQTKLTKYDDNNRLVQRGFGIRYTTGGHWYAQLFAAIVESEGAKLIDAKNNPRLTTPAAVRAMQVFKDVSIAPEVSKDVQTSPYQDFADGLDVMSYGGANAVSFVERLNPKMKGNILIAPMPTLSGKKYGGSIKYSFNYSVNKNATPDQQYVAWSLINYMLDHPAPYWDKTGAIQPRKTFFSTPSVKKFPYINVVESELQYAQALPETKYWDQLQTAIQNAVQQVVFSHVDIKTALKSAQAQFLKSIGK